MCVCVCICRRRGTALIFSSLAFAGGRAFFPFLVRWRAWLYRWVALAFSFGLTLFGLPKAEFGVYRGRFFFFFGFQYRRRHGDVYAHMRGFVQAFLDFRGLLIFSEGAGFSGKSNAFW